MSAGVNKTEKDSTQKGASGKAYIMALFSATIFISAALLFLIEPMFAKFILPFFGSTPSVWTGSMMFFQAALLASYLYVHATTQWLGARRQAVLHLVVVLLPLLVLPIAVPAEEWAPPAESNPILWLLGLLLVAVGLPFFAIAATNPLIQRWLSETDHPAAGDPYFLYRASNLGSVIGLLGYPLLVEPSLRLVSQGILWSIGYGLLVVLVFASAVVLWRSAPAASTTATTQEEEPGSPVAAEPTTTGGMAASPTLLRRLRWIGLAFVPSSLMLGVTAFITTDITPVPLLWVIPLSLYLFSFVVVFSRNQRTPDLIHRVMVVALPVALAVLTVTMLTDIRNPYWLLILVHLLGFFIVAMVLHGELARDRPPVRHLTEFYLWVSVGGVLGGIFNALIAPIAFDSVIEYPLALVLAGLFLPGAILARLTRQREEERRDLEDEERSDPQQGSTIGRRLLEPNLLLDLMLPLALGMAIVALGWIVDNVIDPEYRIVIWQVVIGLGVGVCLWFAYASNRALRFGLGLAALVVAVNFANGSTALLEDRSFFGAYTVRGDGERHSLIFGSTNHGAQVFDSTPPEPITYYHRTGPIGQLFDALPNETRSSPAAMIGLGTGTMSCYAQPGQQFTFYEIDPLIQRIASDSGLFTYMRDCPGESEVVLGDARLSLQEAPDTSYGVIVADAFSSDAIPVHLMTREAVELYFRKLKDDGVMSFHISNRHLELEPVVGNLARDRGFVCYAQYDSNAEDIPNKFGSHWTVIARDDAGLGSLPSDSRWQPCATTPDADDVWTDDFSNLLSTFEWK
ncbi:MAG TPA: fused MFS/spermidine synthase [Rubrobacteraceae bacterium]|nr:fused MFS/spermidine synthase [Rubrobacteraceae bacterium]